MFGPPSLLLNPLPFSTEDALEEIEASVEAVERFIFYGIGSFRGCFLWKLPLKLPVALPRKLPRSCVHFHELPHGYLLPFTSTSSHEL